jgi:hypothetical protein
MAKEVIGETDSDNQKAKLLPMLIRITEWEASAQFMKQG